MEVVLSKEEVDAQECDLLVTGIFRDERPLRGTSGWIDWRLNGRLSHLLIHGKLSGEWRETILIPSGSRISPRMILILGLGRTRDYGYFRLRETLPHLIETMKNLRVSSACVSLPYAEEYNVDGGKWVEIFLEGMLDCFDRWRQSPDEEWFRNLRLVFTEGAGGISEMFLAVQAVQSLLENRLKIRLLVPAEETNSSPSRAASS